MSKTFRESLKQSASSFRDSQVDSLAENLEANYEGEISNLFLKLKDLYRTQNDLIISLYPDTTIATRLCADFNPAQFIQKDTEIMLKAREYRIKLTILTKRFVELFNRECRDKEAIDALLNNIESEE